MASIVLPDWMTSEQHLTLATWWLVFATFSLVVTGLAAVVFAWIQIGVQRGQTRIDNLEMLTQWFEGDRLRQVRQKLAIARITSSGKLKKLDLDDAPDAAIERLDFFEHVAFLVRRGHLRAYDVWHTFAHWIASMHADFKEYIAIEQVHDRTVYCDFTLLFNKLLTIERREKGSGLHYDGDDLEGHYEYERALEGIKVPGRRKPRRKKGNREQEPPKNEPTGGSQT